MNISLSEKTVCFVQNSNKSLLHDDFNYTTANLEQMYKFFDFMSKPNICLTDFSRAEFTGTDVVIFCDNTAPFTSYNWIEIIEHSEQSVNNISIKITKIESDKIYGTLTKNRKINIVVENGKFRVTPLPISNLSYLSNLSFKWNNFYVLFNQDTISIYKTLSDMINNIKLTSDPFKHSYDKSFILFYNETDLTIVGYNNKGRPYINSLIKQDEIITIAFNAEYEYNTNTKKLLYKGAKTLNDIKIDLVTYGERIINLPIPLAVNNYFNTHSNAYVTRMVRNSSLNAFDILNFDGDFAINYGGTNYNLYIPFYIKA